MALNITAYEGVSLTKSGGRNKIFDTRFTKETMKKIQEEVKKGEIRTDAKTITSVFFKGGKVGTTGRVSHELKNFIHINNAVLDYINREGEDKANVILQKEGMTVDNFLEDAINIRVDSKTARVNGEMTEMIILNEGELNFSHKNENSWQKCLCSEFSEMYLNK